MRQPPSFQNINRPTKGDNTIESWMFINNSTQSVPPQKKKATRKKKNTYKKKATNRNYNFRENKRHNRDYRRNLRLNESQYITNKFQGQKNTIEKYTIITNITT